MRGSDSGYAAVDALVALTILSTTIIFSISAGEAAKRAAQRAYETRQANELMRYLIAAPEGGIGALEGKTGAFSWRLETQLDSSVIPFGALALCDRRVDLTDANGRTFQLSSASFCLRPSS